MRYFATADDKETAGKLSRDSAGGMTEVEEQILGKVPFRDERILIRVLWH